MQLLKTAFHANVSAQDITPASGLSLIVRQSARAIVLRGEDVLLLYTRRYDDYSLPGGGSNPTLLAGTVVEFPITAGTEYKLQCQAFGCKGWIEGPSIVA